MEDNGSNIIINSYKTLLKYQEKIKDLYRFTDFRISLDEYGISLKPILKNKLFGLSEEGMLYSNQFFPWISPWYGRFYVDQSYVPEGVNIDNCSGENLKYLAFIWYWVGCNDVHVAPVEQPECWIGIAKPEPENSSANICDIANGIWSNIRIRTGKAQNDGWLKGHFVKGRVSLNLNGWYLVKRIPDNQLSDLYQIQTLIIRQLSEKFFKVVNPE